MDKKQRESEKQSKPYKKPALVKEKQLQAITTGGTPISSPSSELGCTRQMFGRL